MTIIGQTQTFLGDGDQHVSADRDPDSLLDCILAGVQKRLDTQIQLDPCEAQLGLPTLSAQTCNQSGFEHEMVDREHDALSGLVLDYGATQRRWIVFAEVKSRQHTDLIAYDIGVESVDGPGVAALELGVGLGPSDEIGADLMDQEQPPEIEIAQAQQIAGAGLDLQIIQGVDLVCFAVADMDERRNRAAQVQQGVQLDCRLVLTKRGPRIPICT